MTLNPEWMVQLEMLCIPNYFARVVHMQSGKQALSGVVKDITLLDEQLFIEAIDIHQLETGGDAPGTWRPHQNSRTFTLPIASLVRPPFESNGVICLQTKIGITIDLIPNALR